jgi:hypothetical protein
MIEQKTISKYKGKTVANLKVIAQKWFNTYIRYRDTDENGFGRCISSGQTLKIPSKNAQAGHFYAAGPNQALRYNEDNCHLQGLSDNYFKSGNQLEYRRNLINKIGEEKVLKLDEIAAYWKGKPYRFDRFTLIEIIERYKFKAKELKKTKNF